MAPRHSASISRMCIKLQRMKQLGQRCCQEGILLGSWHGWFWKKRHNEEIYWPAVTRQKGLGREKCAEIKADVHAVTEEENDYAFYWPEGVVNENVTVGCESFNAHEGLRMKKCQFSS